jgi:4-hydroxymandelate oxidase
VRLLTAADFAVAGRKRIDPIVWDFVEGGAGSEITLEANRRMFDNLEIEPRALVDVSTCDTKSRIFDATLPTPIGIAPTAYHRMVWDEGEIATAQGVNGALFIVSIFASCTLEDIAHHATGPLWLQLYWLQQREVLSELVKRASTAGYQAIVLTVDAPRIGRRLRDIRNDFGVPSHIQAVNLDAALMTSAYDADGIAKHARQTFDQTITWSDLEFSRECSRPRTRISRSSTASTPSSFPITVAASSTARCRHCARCPRSSIAWRVAALCSSTAACAAAAMSSWHWRWAPRLS